MVGLARRFGRYGYKRITGLLQMAGWNVNAKHVQRIWRSEGLKVPARTTQAGRLWLADGSCIRLRPEHRNHVWAYDFVSERPTTAGPCGCSPSSMSTPMSVWRSRWPGG